MAILPDGKVLLAGLFTEIYGQPRTGIVRFLADGAVDTSFMTVEGVEPSLVVAMEPQRDGKVLLGGQVWNGSAYRPVVRLNANGSVDASFTTTVNEMPRVFRQQADGKILMGGNFTQVNGDTAPKLVRLNLDGTLDGSFNLAEVAGAVTSEPKKVLVQPDGKILVGGTVTRPLVRLNTDGTVDTAFTEKVQAKVPGVIFTDIALQSDGRIVGVGTFTLANPSVVNAVRFKTDGSVDPDCFVISRPNGPLLAVAAQVDGSLLMGGSFSDVAVGADPGNNHYYHFTPVKSAWLAAEAEAVKLGGHLVSIGSAKENKFLMESMLPQRGLTNYPVWMGFRDQGLESVFSWTSGEPATYTNWYPGEPGGGTSENFTAMNWLQAYNGTAPGTWVDIVEAGTTGSGGLTDAPYYGIIEVDPGSTPATQNWVAGRDLLANEQAGAAQELTNPNATVPQWSYGTRTTLTSATRELNLFTGGEHSNFGRDWEGWLRTPYTTTGVVAEPNGFAVPSGHIRHGEINFHPPATGYNVIRWTAPEAGTYSISALWQDVNWVVGDGCNASIVKNGTVVLYNHDFDNRNGRFASQVETLNAGDVIDFMLGPRAGDPADSTRFNAMITKVENAQAVWVGGRDLAANEKPDGPNELLNPNPTVPAWSYGRRSTIITSGLDLYTGAGSHVTGGGAEGPMEGWGIGAAALIVNTNSNPDAPPHTYGSNIPINSQELLVAPAATGGPHPVVRWTAPEAGRYDVLAYWQDTDPNGGNGVTAHILVNGAQVYGQIMENSTGCSTVQSLDLKAGDLVDFVLGDRGEFTYDIAKFDVVIARPAGVAPRTVVSGTVTQAATRAEIEATGKIDWTTAAANGVDVNGNPFVIESSAGQRYHVRKATMGNFRRLTQGSGWAGNFAPGAALLSHGNSDGPVIIESASLTGGCSAIGMQIQPNLNAPGPFVATLRAYDANGLLLGTFTANGTSGTTADNSAVFIGVKSTAENIHSVSVDTNTTDWGGDFAINEVSIKAATSSSLSNPRTNFARLVPTNSTRPISFYAAFFDSIFPPNAPTTLYLTSEVTGALVSFATLESSTDGVTFQPFGYGASTGSGNWSFPVAALPPGYNYFRAMLRNADREEARSHATVLVTPPVVTSVLAVEGEVGEPFSYTGMATGKLTGFATTSLPAWATATFDANSNRLTISGTPTTGGTQNITLQPANEAGSTSSVLALSIISSFTSWQEANFTAGELANPNISGPLGDATGAGIKNLIKYALGIPPKQAGISGLPTGAVVQDAGSKYLTLTYTRDVGADVTLTVEVSGSMGAGTWVSGSPHTTELSRVPQAGNKETVTVRDNVPFANGVKHFMRLKVTE